jgi:GNAT superfamily N-acetyltransferase
MTEPSFTPATLENVEELLLMMREFYAHEGLTFDQAIARCALQGIISDKTLGRVFLIVSENTVAGYAALTFGYSLEFHGRDAFVDELYLRAEYRSQGYGRRALDFLSRVCLELGIKALHLEVERENTRAQAVYREFGFKDHDRYLMTKWVETES